MKNEIIQYNPRLKELARHLRKNSTISEIILWKEIKCRKLGVEFHRQVPVANYIIDFYCHELRIAIEVDGITHQGEAIKNDETRQKALEEHGIHFIRISDLEVKQNLEGVVTHIRNKIDRFKML